MSPDGRIDLTRLAQRSVLPLAAQYVAHAVGGKLRLVPRDDTELDPDAVVFRTGRTEVGRRSFTWLYLNGGSGRRGRPSAEATKRAEALLTAAGIPRRGRPREVVVRLEPGDLVITRRA